MFEQYLRFWYQVFTWVSVRLSLAANSSRSWTLRYFWRSKLFSSVCSWWSVKAVRALRCFRPQDDGDGWEEAGRDEELPPPPPAPPLLPAAPDPPPAPLPPTPPASRSSSSSSSVSFPSSLFVTALFPPRKECIYLFIYTMLPDQKRIAPIIEKLKGNRMNTKRRRILWHVMPMNLCVCVCLCLYRENEPQDCWEIQRFPVAGQPLTFS